MGVLEWNLVLMDRKVFKGREKGNDFGGRDDYSNGIVV